MIKMGTVTFCFEGTEDEVDKITETILTTIEMEHPDIFERCSVSEDTDEYDENDQGL